MNQLFFPTISFNNIKSIMLDLDNTLYLYKPCHQFALQASYIYSIETIKLNISELTFKNLYRKHRSKVTKSLAYHGSCRSRSLAFQGLLEELNIPRAWSFVNELDQIYWNHFLSQMYLDPSAKKFLNTCQKHHIKICIVTDMLLRIQIQKIQRLQITNHIDYIVSSEEVGHEKPNHNIFKRAWNKIITNDPNAKKGSCIMIGDSLEKDIQGAIDFGIKAFQITMN